MGMIIQNGKLFSGEPKTTYIEKILWSGSETPTTSGTDITLSDDLYSYDEVVFKTYNPTYSQYAIIPFTTSLIDMGITYMSIINTVIGLGVCFTVNSGNSIKIKRISTGSETTLIYTKIVGIKYGDTVKRKDYHVYSTEEKIVGEWIDGSTVYEKVLEISEISSNTTVNIPHGITGLANIVSYSGYATYASNTFIPIPYTRNSSYIILNTWDSANIVLEKSNLSSSATNIKVIIRYTKSST